MRGQAFFHKASVLALESCLVLFNLDRELLQRLAAEGHGIDVLDDRRAGVLTHVEGLLDGESRWDGLGDVGLAHAFAIDEEFGVTLEFAGLGEPHGEFRLSGRNFLG